jgi:hypothetical protein
MATSFLLGPQRPIINLAAPFAAIAGDGPVALVSAGWQEVEGEFAHVEREIPRPLVNLGLYQRAETVLGQDPDLKEIYRARQATLQEQQRLYRLRLRQTMLAARRLLREEGDSAMLRQEQRHAIAQQKALDRHHLQRIAAINAEYAALAAARPRPELDRQRAEIDQQLAGCDTVVLAGGNVAVLLNRLQLFDLGPALRQKNIVAWSAGAMVLAERIVLYHDNMPQGNQDAELFNEGLGIIANVVFLPDARHRLKQSDSARVSLFCQRFAPAACVTLDSGAMLEITDGRIRTADGVRRLARSGRLQKLRAR